MYQRKKALEKRVIYSTPQVEVTMISVDDICTASMTVVDKGYDPTMGGVW